jgi:hypothetical protein
MRWLSPTSGAGRVPLRLHPESRCDAVRGIEVETERAGETLRLRYVATGAIGELLVPAPAEHSRMDGLWRHTCFEAFVRSTGCSAYEELNFAPSGQWAAYRFEGYRQGMNHAALSPAIEVLHMDDRLELVAEVHIPSSDRWHLGLAAVIEEQGGRKSYWALAHPPGAADFHHEDCFALELPPAA